MKNLNRDKGYSMVELLMTMIIMGSLVFAAIVVVMPQLEKQTMKGDIMSFSKGQETFMVKNPGSFGTTSVKSLQGSLSGLSRGNYVGTSVKEGVGYCVVGYSGTSMPNSKKEYVWYDSLANGFLEAPDENTAPVGGACEGLDFSSGGIMWFSKE